MLPIQEVVCAMNDKTPPELTVHKASKEQQALIEMQQNLDLMKKALPSLIEYHGLMAKVRYERYRAYVSAGFNEEQALMLVTHDGSKLT